MDVGEILTFLGRDGGSEGFYQRLLSVGTD